MRALALTAALLLAACDTTNRRPDSTIHVRRVSDSELWRRHIQQIEYLERQQLRPMRDKPQTIPK